VKIESALYKPFGEQSEWVLPGNAAPETKGWIGGRYDADAGLQYLNARYYDPALGQFLQPDWFEVMEAGVGTNRFSYSFNDPVNKWDPNGNVVESPWDALNVALGAVSLASNVYTGNYWGAALDAAGIVVDGFATAVPGVPGGASAAITIGRIAKAANVVRSSTAKVRNVFEATKHVADVNRLASKIENNLDHLTTKDILGAVKDIFGNPVAKPGGGVYNHLQEVESGLKGLKNGANRIKELLGDPKIDLSKEEREALEGLLSETSKHIDRVEKTLDTAKSIAKSEDHDTKKP
jgi:RHS repeat-associated protein